MTTFRELLHPRGQASNAGQFRAKTNDAPAGSLAQAADPAGEALAFVSASAPDGLTEAQQTAFEDASAQLRDEQLFTQQPLSYIAFLAHQQHESSERMSGRVAADSPDVAAYWAARAERADEIANELYRLAGKNRYPNRAPESVGSDTRTGEEVLRELFAEHGDHLSMIDPEGVTATRAALTNRRGEPDGGVRLVGLSWASKPPTSDASEFEVTGPADGRPIIIDVRSGCPTMRVTSGHAVIIVGGSGFGIDIAEGARATILAQPGKKISLTAEEGSTVDFYPEPDTRGYQSVRDGATFRMHGRADNVTLSTDRDELM